MSTHLVLGLRVRLSLEHAVDVRPNILLGQELLDQLGVFFGAVARKVSRDALRVTKSTN
jgi:hypothetical protein